jgi:hypothetical protein
MGTQTQTCWASGQGRWVFQPTVFYFPSAGPSHLGQCLHVDDVDEAEEEGHLCGNLGYIGKQAALR